MAALLEGLRALGSGRVLDEVLALVLDSAIEVTGAERGFIMLANRRTGQLEFKLARARGKVTLSGRTFETSRKIPETVFATGQQTIVEDLLDGDLAQLHTGTVALGIRHVLCTPLRLVRYVERAEQKSPTSVDRRAVSRQPRAGRAAVRLGAARRSTRCRAEAALAIENARLYREALDKAKFEQELKVAAAIQQSLLPARNRNGAFFSTAAASVACRAVGGDFFDYVDLPTGGSASSSATSPARDRRPRCWRRRCSACSARRRPTRPAPRRYHPAQRGPVPPRDRSAISDGVLRHAGAGRFADSTATPATTRRCSCQSPGIQRLETGGVVLGLFEPRPSRRRQLTLKPGDLLLPFSDGVTEAMNSGGRGVHRRPADCLRARACRRAPAGGARRAARRRQGVLRRRPQSDDVTAVMVRYNG